jgi:hypothetical protein
MQDRKRACPAEEHEAGQAYSSAGFGSGTRAGQGGPWLCRLIRREAVEALLIIGGAGVGELINADRHLRYQTSG